MAGSEKDWIGAKGPVFRRPLSLTKPERELRRSLARAFDSLGTKVNRRLTKEGALQRIHQDAERRQAKGPIGRGGQPFGEEREQAIRRIFQYDDMRWIADLFSGGPDVFDEEFSGILADEYTRLFEIGGQAGRRALGVKGTFNLRATGVVDALGKRANKLSGNVADEIFERLKTVIADEFYLQGKGPREVGKILASEFDWLSRSRAELIARTEAGTVTEAGQFLTYRSSGVARKRWLTTLDGRERPTHFKAHGQIRAIDEYFNVGDHELMYPLDPECDCIEEIARCRCTHIPIVSDLQLTDNMVWDGENEPDEFARHWAELADAPPSMRPPPPDDIDDLNFAFPEDEKRIHRQVLSSLGDAMRDRIEEEAKAAPRLPGSPRFHPGIPTLKEVLAWFGTARKHLPGEHDQDTHGREGDGEDDESSEESGGGSESSAKRPPRMSDEAYNAGKSELDALHKAAESAGATLGTGGSLTAALFVPATDDGQHGSKELLALDAKAAELGPQFFQRYYEENPQEYEKAVEHMSKAWAHIGGTGPNQIRFAAQDAFGFPQAPVWDSKSGGNVDRSTSTHDAGTVAAYAGAMRHEWEETQAAMDAEPQFSVTADAKPSIDDFYESEDYQEWEQEAIDDQRNEGWKALDDDEKLEIYNTILTGGHSSNWTEDRAIRMEKDMREWSKDNLVTLASMATSDEDSPAFSSATLPMPGDGQRLSDDDLSALRGADPAQESLSLDVQESRPTYGEVREQLAERYAELKADHDALDQWDDSALNAEQKAERDRLAQEMIAVNRQASDWRSRTERQPEHPDFAEKVSDLIDKWGPAAYAASDQAEFKFLREQFDEDFEPDYDSIDSSEAFNEWAFKNSTEEEIDIDLSEPTITLHRGVHRSTNGYVSGPVESWSASEKVASDFGSNVMTEEVDRRRVLVFQGAPSWNAEGFGTTEFEFMVLPDLPSWLREDAQPSGPQP